MGASAWAAWVAIGLTIAAALIRDGMRRGRIDNVLETLTALVDDHEDRLRYQEGRPPRHRKKRPSGGRHGPD